jgi:hypothetical protein
MAIEYDLFSGLDVGDLRRRLNKAAQQLLADLESIQLRCSPEIGH